MALEVKRNATTLRDYALLGLLRGDLDASVKALQAASALAPDDARILADLSAMYLERAVRHQNPIDLLHAFGASERALHGRPSFPTAMFNKALIMEHLHLELQAARAWIDLMRVEDNPTWRLEAQKRFDDIAGRLAHGNRLIEYETAFCNHIDARDWDAVRRLLEADSRRGRQTIEEVLLARWAEAVSRRDPRLAAHHLSTAAMAARLYTAVTGDPFLQSLTESILESGGHSAGGSDLLARVHQEYVLGRRRMAAGNYSEALVLFTQAEARLASSSSPLSLRIRQVRATASYFLGRRQEAKGLLTVVRAVAAQRGYVALEGESFWLLGLCEFGDDDYANAQGDYEAALALFRSMGERENVAGAQNLIAETLDRQGAFAEGWRHRYRALELLSVGSDPLRLYQLYAVAAISAVAIEQPEAALAFQRAAVAAARRLANPVALAHALMWQARYETRAGNLARAHVAAEKARAAGERIADVNARETAEVGALLAQAEVALVRRPRAALRLLDAALISARAADSSYHLVDVYFLRARVRERLAQWRAAADELERCIAHLESRRTRIRDLARHYHVTAASRAAFDRAASLQVSRLGNVCKAFDYVERRRARESGDLISDLSSSEERVREARSNGAAEWPGCAVARSSLSSGEAIVSYAELEGKLYAWVLTRSALRLARIDSTPAEIKRGITGLRRAALQHEARGFRHLAAALGKTLLEPLRLHSERVTRINFVVDPPYDGIPYAALINPATGRYLVRDYATVLDPSVAAYLSAARRREARRLGPSSRVALFGDPAFSRAGLPGLSSLPRAREQTLKNAELYKQATVFLGADATPERFLREASRARIVQFAGHAVVRHRAPLWSHLIFASPSTDVRQGYVTAGDIYSIEIKNTELVVLAICGGLVEEKGFGASFVGPFARAFLAAGAVHVVATLWPIEDGEAAAFLHRFHQHFSLTGDPARALQQAQRDFSQRPGAWTWVAFQSAGA